LAVLTQDQFKAFATGKVEQDTPLYKELQDKNFLRNAYNQDRASSGIGVAASSSARVRTCT